MAYTQEYTPTEWENSPSQSTPINETNLMNIENGILLMDDRTVELSTSLDNLQKVFSLLPQYASISINRSGTTGPGSISWGGGNEASGQFTISFGLANINKASGALAHGTNNNVSVNAQYSVTMGNGNSAGCQFVFIFGDHDTSTANAYGSAVFGQQNTANANYVVVEGFNNTASGQYQHVMGRYALEDTTGLYALIIGNGTSSTRKNIFAIDWNGNVISAGDISANGVSLGDMSKMLFGVHVLSLSGALMTRVIGGQTEIAINLFPASTAFTTDKTIVRDADGTLGVVREYNSTNITVETITVSAAGADEPSLLGNVNTDDSSVGLPQTITDALTVFGRTPGIDDYAKTIDSTNNVTEWYISAIDTDGNITWGNPIIINTADYQAQTAASDAGKVPVIGATGGQWGAPVSIDAAPTDQSQNLISSAAVYNAIGAEIQRATDAEALKANLPEIFIEGNFMSADAAGNPIDSGNKPADFLLASDAASGYVKQKNITQSGYTSVLSVATTEGAGEYYYSGNMSAFTDLPPGYDSTGSSTIKVMKFNAVTLIIIFINGGKIWTVRPNSTGTGWNGTWQSIANNTDVNANYFRTVSVSSATVSSYTGIADYLTSRGSNLAGFYMVQDVSGWTDLPPNFMQSGSAAFLVLTDNIRIGSARIVKYFSGTKTASRAFLSQTPIKWGTDWESSVTYLSSAAAYVQKPEVFTADGSTDTFTISKTPSYFINIWVYRSDGQGIVLLFDEDYTVDGTRIKITGITLNSGDKIKFIYAA